MNSIKLTISTGKQDTDIIDLGLYNPSIEGPCSMGFVAGLNPPRQDNAMDNLVRMGELNTLPMLNGLSAATVSLYCTGALSDMNTNPDKYKVFHVADLLAAQDYLNKLKIACDTYPACTVKIETL